jgi:flavodoxin
MNIEIRYLTRSGNTKKLADAIGSAVNASAKPISEPLDTQVDLLFLGGSVYAGGIDSALKAFINGLTPTQVKKVAVFSTAAVAESAYKQIKKHLLAKGITVLDAEFHCRGSFTVMHWNRPNAKDLENAAKFAKDVLLAESRPADLDDTPVSPKF